MAGGAGKYDDVATQAREAAEAKDGVVLIVLNGKDGSGFSVQATAPAMLFLPELLRHTADQIEADLKAGVWVE